MVALIIINCSPCLVAAQRTFTDLGALLLDIISPFYDTPYNHQGYRNLKLFQEVVLEVLSVVNAFKRPLHFYYFEHFIMKIF